MKVIVTGGSGFVGTNVVEDYLSRGCDVSSIDLEQPRNPAHLPVWSRLDIRNGDDLDRAFRTFSPDVIVHLAARTDLDGTSLADYSANTDGVKNVIAAAKRLPNPRRVIFASSMLVCALGYRPKTDTDYSPTTTYGESKVLSEEFVRAYAAGSFPWTIVRPTSLWGPWFGVPYRGFFDAVAKRLYVHPAKRRIVRSDGFVLNSVHQLNRIATSSDRALLDQKMLYLADYEPVELYHWACLISAAFGVPRPPEVPLPLLRVAARAGDVLKRAGVRNPPLTSFRLNNLLTDAVFDMEPLSAVAGTTPYSVAQGVAITAAWMRSGQLPRDPAR